MKKLLLLAALCLLPQHSAASDDWSKSDIALQVTYTVLHVVDWGQTRNLSRNYQTSKVAYNDNDCYYGKCSYIENKHNYEVNPILGKNPHHDAVDLYFISTIVGHTVISHLLPDNYRTLWQCITIGVEGAVVNRNINVGAKFKF